MRKQGVAIVAAVVLALVGSASVSAGPSSPPSAVQDDRVRVAVLNFENNSTWHWWGDRLGEAAADELVTQLFKSGNFSVIERQQLQAILAEQNFGQSGRVQASTAAEIGKILGVQAILTGSITKFSIQTRRGGIAGIGASYSEAESALDVRLINVNTAEIMLADESEGKIRMGGGFIGSANYQQNFDAGVAQEALRPAVEQIVEKIVAQSGALAAIKPPAPAGQIVGAREGQFYINRGENFSVQVGQRFDVVRVVDEIRDADGNVLDRITDTVGVIEVVQVLSQSSICRVVEGEAAEGDNIRGQG